jgi:hypothetical protein
MPDIKLRLKLPSAQAPGYLRFQQKITAFKDMLNGASRNLAEFESGIQVLVDMVEEPIDRVLAQQILMDLSLDDLSALVQRMERVGEPPLENKAA